MQRRQECHLGLLAHRVPQGQGAVCGQLGEQPIRQRLDAVFLLRLRGGFRAAMDGVAACRGIRRRVVRFVPAAIGINVGLRFRRDRQLVLRPYVAPLNLQGARAVDANERAGARDLIRFECDGPILKRAEHRLDLSHAPIDLFRQVLDVAVLVLKPVVFFAQRVPCRFLLGRERHDVAAKLAQPEMVAVGEVGRDLDPLPALGRHRLRLALELLDRELVEQTGILQPASVVALEQVAHHGAASLFIGVDADEQRALVSRTHRAFGQHAPDDIGFLRVRLAQPVVRLLLPLVVAVDRERHQLVER